METDSQIDDLAAIACLRIPLLVDHLDALETIESFGGQRLIKQKSGQQQIGPRTVAVDRKRLTLQSARLSQPRHDDSASQVDPLSFLIRLPTDNTPGKIQPSNTVRFLDLNQTMPLDGVDDSSPGVIARASAEDKRQRQSRG